MHTSCKPGKHEFVEKIRALKILHARKKAESFRLLTLSAESDAKAGEIAMTILECELEIEHMEKI